MIKHVLRCTAGDETRLCKLVVLSYECGCITSRGKDQLTTDIHGCTRQTRTRLLASVPRRSFPQPIPPLRRHHLALKLNQPSTIDSSPLRFHDEGLAGLTLSESSSLAQAYDQEGLLWHLAEATGAQCWCR